MLLASLTGHDRRKVKILLNVPANKFLTFARNEEKEAKHTYFLIFQPPRVDA
ncbi:predicted protein [Histoplasma mississippiense (nom. inval.)]|uniref:predicted protein n=1 Tax=Ajellomyces capsulatus (strain NAm1 / WU24) TaxID=2059318 RepID=UPI000157B4CE|nr:predicted protein [Histoplasma mississippiense (nom. inval.)]EDN02802.1 predicted protein [Histoplasma mississippiense (nom. inval.)]